MGEITIEEERQGRVIMDEWGQLIVGDFSDLGQKLLKAIAQQLKTDPTNLLNKVIKFTIEIKVKYHLVSD
jgi:hypothetical protein